MKLSRVIKNLAVVKKPADASVDITGVKIDSRKVVAGDLFIAVSGFKDDGSRFIADAVQKGAAAVITEKEAAGIKIPQVLVADARACIAPAAKTFYGRPDEKLSLFGITGTNGKTTTAHMIWWILNKQGQRASLLGTIKHNILGREIDASNTTPESIDLYSFFKETVKGRGKSVVMEVSSHAIALGRIGGMQYSVAVFTNLTHDHLDFHKDMQDYFSTKARLFTEYLKKDGAAVINIDDSYGRELVKILEKERKDVRIITYGLDKKADIHPQSYTITWEGITLKTKFEEKKISIKSQLCGTFNLSNIMAGLGAALAYGIKPDKVAKAIAEFDRVAGRFETVRAGQPFPVIVDYAHTPDALERILQNARMLTKGKVIAVFGCGGDRDRTKRPVMGEIATRLADMAVVTSDNPRTEKPEDIIKEILTGIHDITRARVEPDRKKAIGMALAAAGKDDCVVIAGKGHEDYQILGTEKHHFDDKEIAREFLTGKSA